MLERHCLARLVDSRGLRIRVLSGRVWIAEEAAASGTLLEPGAEYVVEGDGPVLVQQEAVDRRGATAEIAISSPCELPAAWKLALGGP